MARVSWYWRLVIWTFAVPFGFIVTAFPAWRLGLIQKGDVLDVFVRSGVGRFERVAIGIVVWSLITASVVQLLVVFAARRRNQTRHGN
jgi:hypothetical protein